MKAQCPACSHEFIVGLVASIPKEQVFTLDITTQSPFISACIFGGVIEKTAELLEALGKDMNSKVHAFIKSVECQPHKVSVSFLVTSVRR